MATFVLVHGAWHGGWCWRHVRHLLEKSGHQVHAPSLTGLGEQGDKIGSITPPPLSLWGLTKPEHIDFVEPREVRHPYRTMSQRIVLRNESALGRLPKTFVY